MADVILYKENNKFILGIFLCIHIGPYMDPLGLL